MTNKTLLTISHREYLTELLALDHNAKLEQILRANRTLTDEELRQEIESVKARASVASSGLIEHIREKRGMVETMLRSLDENALQEELNRRLSFLTDKREAQQIDTRQGGLEIPFEDLRDADVHKREKAIRNLPAEQIAQMILECAEMEAKYSYAENPETNETGEIRYEFNDASEIEKYELAIAAVTNLQATGKLEKIDPELAAEKSERKRDTIICARVAIGDICAELGRPGFNWDHLTPVFTDFAIAAFFMLLAGALWIPHSTIISILAAMLFFFGANSLCNGVSTIYKDFVPAGLSETRIAEICSKNARRISAKLKGNAPVDPVQAEDVLPHVVVECSEEGSENEAVSVKTEEAFN